MLHLHVNKRFLERQNKRVNVFPKVNGQTLEEFAQHRYSYLCESPIYFSLVEKDPYVGLCEVVYGVKKFVSQNRICVQKLMVIPAQNTIPLIRNLYYQYGLVSGFHSYGYTGKRNSRFEFMPGFDWADSTFPIEKTFWDCDQVSLKDLSDIDPSLKYCAYDSDSWLSVVQYIRLYKAHSMACEMLMKCRLYRFLNEKTLVLLEEHKDFAFWCAKNAKNLKYNRMAPRTAYNAWKKNPSGDPRDYYDSLMKRIEAGRCAAFENKAVYRKALKYTTQEKIVSYLDKNRTSSATYGDYLIACDWLHLDFSDTKVLFPHDFWKMHDDYTSQYGAWQLEQETKREKKNADETRLGMSRTAKRFAYLSGFEKDGYLVMVATCKEDLIKEGSRLHHCVGRMDYDKRQAKGESIICMLRKASDPLTPYVTAEVKITPERLRVVQCYGDHDKIVPEVDPFTREWMSYCNKIYSKERKKDA